MSAETFEQSFDHMPKVALISHGVPGVEFTVLYDTVHNCLSSAYHIRNIAFKKHIVNISNFTKLTSCLNFVA